MIITILGNKEYDDYKDMERILVQLHNKYVIDKVISSGEKGASKIGELFAIKHNIKLEIIKNDITFIIKSSDLIINIWDESKETEDIVNMCYTYLKNIRTFDSEGYYVDEVSKIFRPIGYKYKWARVVKRGEPYYECSSKGNKDLSALYAFIGRKSIEEIYQLDIKGYRGKVRHWKEAKGKPPLNKGTEHMFYLEYVKLWQEYLSTRKELYFNLLKEAKDKTITDMFGVSNINQARALCDLCNNGFIY